MPSFDTHATFHTLQTHGFSPEQAEGVTVALASVLETSGKGACTRADLDLHTTTLRGELRELRVLVDSRCQTVDAKFTFTHWMIGLTFTVLLGFSLGNLWLLVNLLSRLPRS